MKTNPTNSLFAMSDSNPHIITQLDEDPDDFTMMDSLPFTQETDHLAVANFDHVPAPQPPIHPFFGNKPQKSKAASPKIHVKGHFKKNGKHVGGHSRSKGEKKASTSDCKAQNAKPFSTKTGHVDMPLWALKFKLDMEDFRNAKRNKNH